MVKALAYQGPFPGTPQGPPCVIPEYRAGSQPCALPVCSPQPPPPTTRIKWKYKITLGSLSTPPRIGGGGLNHMFWTITVTKVPMLEAHDPAGFWFTARRGQCNDFGGGTPAQPRRGAGSRERSAGCRVEGAPRARGSRHPETLPTLLPRRPSHRPSPDNPPRLASQALPKSGRMTLLQ